MGKRAEKAPAMTSPLAGDPFESAPMDPWPGFWPVEHISVEGAMAIWPERAGPEQIQAEFFDEVTRDFKYLVRANRIQDEGRAHMLSAMLSDLWARNFYPATSKYGPSVTIIGKTRAQGPTVAEPIPYLEAIGAPKIQMRVNRLEAQRLAALAQNGREE